MRAITLSKIVIFLTIALFITGYGYSKTNQVFRGPSITVSSPTAGSLIKENLITIEGKAERIAKLYLNGQQIFTDDAGHFTESLIAPVGYSTIYLEAVDIFSRKTITQIPITYNPNHG